MNPPRFDLVITGLLALAVLAAVVAASPDGSAAPVTREGPALGLVDRSPRSSSPDARQAGPGHGAPVAAEGAQQAGKPPVVDAESAEQPSGMRAGVAMGIGMVGLLAVMVWAMALSWRTRARVQSSPAAASARRRLRKQVLQPVEAVGQAGRAGLEDDLGRLFGQAHDAARTAAEVEGGGGNGGGCWGGGRAHGGQG